MVTKHHRSKSGPLAEQARELFVARLNPLVDQLADDIEIWLTQVAQGRDAPSAGDTYLARNAAVAFQAEAKHWAGDVRRELADALNPPDAPKTVVFRLSNLQLIDDDSVERNILASRLGTAVAERASAEYNLLKMRLRTLERGEEPRLGDVLHPETLARELLRAWTERGLTRPMWLLIHAHVEREVAQRMAEGYRDVNEFLASHGVLGETDLKSRVRRTDDAPAPAAKPARPAPDAARPERTPAARDDSGGLSAAEMRTLTAASPIGRMRQRAQGVLGQMLKLLSERTGDAAGRAPAGASLSPAAAATRGRAGRAASSPTRQPAAGVGVGAGAAGSAGAVIAPSPRLARALAVHATDFAVTELMEREGAVDLRGPAAQAQVELAQRQVRQRTTELKHEAEKPSEKAIIEIVALMFQAILAEERIPPGIRVWFARLQIPVLRLALAEPDFFASIDHPARQLIDHMGACALGFDPAQVNDNRLEREIKRVVQVIEQYPETGRRVFELVLGEFKKFLGSALTSDGAAQQAATLAQKVEQKEALSIQYTIELRRMLQALPVQEDMREFLFRVWSEVLALAAVRRGPQHEETLRYKKAAADLLWAVNAKTDRAARGRVLQQLSGVVQVLREGMATLGLSAEEQDAHVKLVNEAVMQAFVSRTEGMSQARLDELARGLAELEAEVTDDPEGDVLLDPDMIELMFGSVGQPGLEVIASGGAQPGPDALLWARELELGQWFALDHGGAVVQVQYVWRSEHGQLHLFSSVAGQSYLVQTRRMAAYLQAGLLAPMEDEALTIRATRAALEKLQAEPTLLLE